MTPVQRAELISNQLAAHHSGRIRYSEEELQTLHEELRALKESGRDQLKRERL